MWWEVSVVGGEVSVAGGKCGRRCVAGNECGGK